MLADDLHTSVCSAIIKLTHLGVTLPKGYSHVWTTMTCLLTFSVRVDFVFSRSFPQQTTLQSFYLFLSEKASFTQRHFSPLFSLPSHLLFP